MVVELLLLWYVLPYKQTDTIIQFFIPSFSTLLFSITSIKSLTFLWSILQGHKQIKRKRFRYMNSINEYEVMDNPSLSLCLTLNTDQKV